MAEKHSEPTIYFGKKPVDSAMVRMVFGLSLVLLFVLVSLLTQSRSSSQFIRLLQPHQTVSTVEVRSAEDLLSHLKANNLWEVEAFSEVPPFLVSNFPEDMSTLAAPHQKKAFLHALLPLAMTALSEVEAERAAFEKILGKFIQPPLRLAFDPEAQDYARLAGLTSDEVSFLQNICRKYRVYGVAELRRRISPVPMSLIMAQGALESAWGGSRLALEKKNLFGVLSWNKVEIESSGMEDGKPYSGVEYANLLDAVRAYILMLNRVPAYHALRKIREETMDSLALVDGLVHYSNRGSDYVAEIAQLIRSNDLQVYDKCILAGKGGLPGRIRLASLVGSR